MQEPKVSLRQKESEQPLYIRVAAGLRRELLAGRFHQVDRLPSEAELVRLLGVSRPTLREALGILEREGWIRRVHGVGTLVVRGQPMPVGHGHERLLSYTDYVTEYGRRPGTARARLRWQSAGQRWSRILGIPEDTRMAVIERVRTADGEPVLFSIDRLPVELVGSDFSLEAMGESLFAYLRRERGVRLSFSQLVVRPMLAGRTLAGLLDMQPFKPVLAMEEVYFGYVVSSAATLDKFDLPLFWSLNIYRPGRWVLRFVRQP